MKSIIALCLFGACAAVMAIPQQNPGHNQGPPQVMVPPRPRFASLFNRPARPDLARRPEHVRPRPPMAGGERHTHPIAPENNHVMHDLMRDVRDFMELIPRREIRNLFRDYMQDTEFRATIRYMRSQEFHAVMHTMMETPEFQAIFAYFEHADWPWIQKTVDEALNEIDAIPTPCE